MDRIQARVRRYPLVVFFALSFGLSWWPWPLYAAGLSPSPVIGFGPFLAALVVLALTTGRQGVRGLLRRMVHWRVGWQWYLLAIGLPLGIAFAAARVNLLLGASPAAPPEVATLADLAATFALLLLLPGVGGAWEEPGWRGYALPRLQEQHPGSIASLLLGLVWGAWHLPLFLAGTIPWSDLVLIVAIAIVYTWIYNKTQGSVLVLMLAHAANNTIVGGYFLPMFLGADADRMAGLLVVLWWAAAYGLILISEHELGRRRSAPGAGDPAAYYRGAEK
jgi:membrane protease YdiL (CAAX protease family)